MNVKINACFKLGATLLRILAETKPNWSRTHTLVAQFVMFWRAPVFTELPFSPIKGQFGQSVFLATQPHKREREGQKRGVRKAAVPPVTSLLIKEAERSEERAFQEQQSLSAQVHSPN